MLAHQVSGSVRDGLAAMGIHPDSHESHAIPDLDKLPAPIRSLYEHAFGDAIGHIFLVSVPFAVLALICVVAIKEVPLRTTVLKDGENG